MYRTKCFFFTTKLNTLTRNPVNPLIAHVVIRDKLIIRKPCLSKKRSCPRI